MKIRITKNHVDALCVLIGVLGMGSLYFQVLRMPLMAALLIASILLLTRAHHPKISAQNIRLTLLLTAALLLTSFVNPQNGIHINDIVIWLCNIGYVLVLQSCIGYQTYMRLYTKVMLAEAAISLISFVIGDLLSLPLPLLHYEVSSVNGFYLTPYFTLGWLNIPVFHRNAGMFNEPGSHQIFLNFALLFLMSDETRMGMSKKKYCWAIALLIVTILSTLSTTGFICLGVVLLTVAFRKKGGKMARSIKMAAFIGLICCLSSSLPRAWWNARLSGEIPAVHSTRGGTTPSAALKSGWNPPLRDRAFSRSERRKSCWNTGCRTFPTALPPSSWIQG